MSLLVGTDKSEPIGLDFKSAQSGATSDVQSMRTFNSYSFERSILTPAAAFRFTAPGVDKSLRTSIRSCDLVTIWATGPSGGKTPLGTGILDETDTHVIPENVDYVLTGRDTLSQLVDNSAIDASNKIINTSSATLDTILGSLLKNTRIPQGYVLQQVPNAKLLFQTTPGETKINALQRFLEFTNCLVWTNGFGQIIIGKPNFTQEKSGQLVLSSTNPVGNNCVEGRSRRGVNKAIRQIVTQLQTFEQVDAGSFTIKNNDPDMVAVAASGGGRSVYRTFSYGQGNDAVNQYKTIGNQSGNPKAMGAQLSLREIARENMNILDVELVTNGHFNDDGDVYQMDQIYNVQIEDDDVSEDMYVYSCSYELTMDRGMMTHLKLCRLGTIVAGADALPRST